MASAPEDVVIEPQEGGSGTPFVDIVLPGEEGDGAFARPAANTARPTWSYQYLSINPSQGIPLEYRFGFREREIKLAICCTAYNEPLEQLNNTLEAVQRNLDKAGVFTNGRLQPHNVLVFCVFDGRGKANRDIFTAEGRYHNTFFTEERDWAGMIAREEQEVQRAEAMREQARRAEAQVGGTTGIAVAHVAHGTADAHVYETTLRLNKDKTTAYENDMQLMFCFKVKNGGKIDSHRWFFHALCKRINPDYCCIIDMGTNPSDTAILRLFMDMEENQQIGGCCGQIAIDTSGSPCAYADPIVAGQVYEYKASNFLDKSMESLFGFISVLPGAFSAYRWDAIREYPNDPHAPLHEYFKLADMSEAALAKVSPWTANMYLAEDRILGFEMLVRKGYDWVLHYNSAAPAYTDCPGTLAAIISQRRRWLNGSYFAVIHVLAGFAKVWDNNHSLGRKLALSVLMLYNALQVVLTFLLLGNSYLIFLLTLRLVLDENDPQEQVAQFTFSTLYLVVTASQFIFALGNSPRDPANRRKINYVYTTCAAIYGVLMLYATIAVFFKADEFSAPVFWTGVFTFLGLYVAALVHGDIVPILLTSVQFVALIPTFLNVFPIFSFCRVHDISWGTRETNPEAAKFKALKEESFKLFRSLFVLAWILINIIFVSIILEFEVTDEYSVVIVVIVVVFLGMRLSGSLIYAAIKWGKAAGLVKCCRRTTAPARNGINVPTGAPAAGAPAAAGAGAPSAPPAVA